MLHPILKQLVETYTQEAEQLNSLWKKIEHHHTEKGRYYHTLQHLENLIGELKSCDELIQEKEAVLWAVFFHDIIYAATRKDNEEKSAELAVSTLTVLGVSSDVREKCRLHILATRSHELSSDNDTNLFTDADLSILGRPWPEYEAYSGQVRKEYRIYPDLVYKPGRKHVLKHFLQLPQIYKTDFFFRKYEQQARWNMEKEMTVL